LPHRSPCSWLQTSYFERAQAGTAACHERKPDALNESGDGALAALATCVDGDHVATSDEGHGTVWDAFDLA